LTAAVAPADSEAMSAAELDRDRTLPPAQPQRRDCPHCGANCWDDDTSCWHCRRRLDGAPLRPHFAQFSIGMILLLMTAGGVAAATFRWFPLLTVLLLLWIGPALLHTYLACRILRHRVPAVDFGERLDRFGLALVYVLPALASGLVGSIAPALMLVAIGYPFGRFLGTSVLIAGGTVGLIVAGWVFWLTLPRPPKASP
jgi:hypothetical protein